MKKVLTLFLIILLAFIKIEIKASNTHAFIVYDVKNKQVIKGENINTISLIASTTKIMTAIIAIEEGNLFDFYKASKEDVEIEGSKVYLTLNERYSLYDLLHGLMLRSGNDCASLIARSVCDYDMFIELMNKKCRELKMLNSTFENPSGLDTLNQNRSTAYDMALLMSYAMENEVFRAISSTHIHKASSVEGTFYKWQNKDKSVINDERFIAGKTGYTKKSGRVLVNYANTNGRDIVIVTINDSYDWVNHTKYLNEISKLKETIILKKGNYKIENSALIVEVKENVKILTVSNKIDITYEMYECDKSHLYIYNYNILVKIIEIKVR